MNSKQPSDDDSIPAKESTPRKMVLACCLSRVCCKRNLSCLIILCIGMFVMTNMSCLVLAMMHLEPNARADFYYVHFDVVLGTNVCEAFGNTFVGTTDSHEMALYGTAVPILASIPLVYVLSACGFLHFKTPSALFSMRAHSLNAGRCSSNGGDKPLWRWSVLLLLLPGLYIMYLCAAIGRHATLDWVDFFEMSVLYAGEAAVMSLSLFLVPVTKHSVWLQALRLDPTHALVFHRVAGWISLFFTVYHGTSYTLAYGNLKLEREKGYWANIWDAMIPPPPCYRFHNLFVFQGSTEAGPGSIHHQNPHGSHKNTPKFRFLGDDGSDTNTTNATITVPTTTDYLGRDEVSTSDDCQAYYRNFCGLVSMCAFILLVLLSLPIIRRTKYRLFYNAHIILGWTMMIGAILHVRSVGYYMAPGIIYYLVSTVPVWVQQFLDSQRHQGASLTRVRKIHDSGNCQELEFRAHPETFLEENKHAFVRLCAPAVSSQWHPFSVIMLPSASPTATGEDAESDLGCPRVRLLFRATGPFTKALARDVCSSSEQLPSTDVDQRADGASTKVLIDAFHPEGSNWFDIVASGRHDSILMVAGGVGIVPFLTLIPDILKLQRERNRAANDSIFVDESTQRVEPVVVKQYITLHWYCRELGLARYIQEEYFDSWSALAGNANDHNSIRLSIVIHATSLPRVDVNGPSYNKQADPLRITDVMESEGATYLEIPGPGKMNQRTMVEGTHWRLQSGIRNSSGPLALVGGLGLLGLALHIWMYKNVISAYRNLTSVRMMPVVATLVASIVISYLAELARGRFHSKTYGDRHVVSTMSEDTGGDDGTMTESSSTSDFSVGSQNLSPELNVKVQRGRPSSEEVAAELGYATAPAVFICGPPKLREAIKQATKLERSRQAPCAVYENLSEM